METLWRAIARFLIKPERVDWLIERAKKTPYTHIGPPESLYMERYWLFNPYQLGDKKDWRRWLPSVRLHLIRREDRDRHHHDHPWNARTILLRGWYHEARTINPQLPGHVAHYHRKAGDTAKIGFGEYHAITDVPPEGVWTMFITWKYQGTWGFLVNGAKVPWKKHLGRED